MKFVPRSESTRKFIIESTADLFNKKGYAGTSIADLEKATNLTKGSIYGNFENKEEVALAVFDYNLEAVQRSVQMASAEHTSYKDKILAYLSVYYGLQGNTGGCPLQNTAVEADDTHEGLRQKAADGINAWIDNLKILLKGGIEAGEFQKDIKVERTALTFFALIEGGILVARATRNRTYFETVLNSATEYIEGICY